MKTHTDYEQSMNLAKFLHTDKADMYWLIKYGKPVKAYLDVGKFPIDAKGSYWPCWSLSALFSILPDIAYGAGCSWEIHRFQNVNKDTEKDQYYISGHDMWDHEIIGPYHDDPVDACVNMIISLHEKNYL